MEAADPYEFSAKEPTEPDTVKVGRGGAMVMQFDELKGLPRGEVTVGQAVSAR